MLTAVDAHLWILLPSAVTLKWSVKHNRNWLLIIVNCWFFLIYVIGGLNSVLHISIAGAAFSGSRRVCGACGLQWNAPFGPSCGLQKYVSSYRSAQKGSQNR